LLHNKYSINQLIAMSPISCLTPLISNSLTFIVFAVGGVFTAFPSIVIDILCTKNHSDSDDNINNYKVSSTLCKLTGGILIAYGSAFLSQSHKNILVSQSVMGLTILLVGLLDDLQSPDGAIFVAIGSCIVLLGCIGLMAAFHPTESNSTEPAVNSHVNIQRPENTVPLLEDVNGGGMDGDIEDNGNDMNAPVEAPFENRITGTKRLMKLAGPHTKYLYAGCVVLLIRLPFSLSIPHFISETLGALARSNYSEAKMNIFLLFALGTVDAALDFWCVFLFGLTNLKITKGVRIDTFAAILKQEIAFFDLTKSGDLTSRLNSDAGEMGYDLTWFFRFSIESVVRIVSIVSYMLWRSPRLGVCAISVVPFVAAINKRYADFLSKNAKEVQNALAQANSVAQEALSCIRTVVAFASEDYEYNKYKGKIVKHYDLNVQQLYAQGFYYMVISTFLINTVVQALLLYVGMVLMERGELSVEVLLAFMLYQSKLQNEVMNLFNSYTSLIKSSGAGDKVFELLDRFIPEPGTGHDGVNAGIDMESSQLSISIQQLNFSYPSRPDQKILTNLDMDIPAGKTVALVGKSGCGKSTIIGLLQRFYDPDGGAVIVNDKNLKDINLKSHRQRIGVVTQDPVLFTGSIRDNILYGAKNKTDADVINAAKLANAHVFIEAFPDGYDTQVGERGMQLSGGQRQRVSIARAIISEPNLLLLDEATSALDTESEKLVQDALDHLLNTNKQMTTVVIAHRLQTVRNADNIIVMDKGCVLEQGTHEELLKLNGVYQKMVKRAEDGRFSDE